MQLVAAYKAPVMVTDMGAITAADAIHAHTAKLQIDDRKRVAAAIEWSAARISHVRVRVKSSQVKLHSAPHP